MKITNNFNMPAVLEEYCRNKFEQEVAVTRSSIGVTSLIDSAWKAHLTRKHWDDLVVDCRDVWFAFQGEYKHMVLDNVRLWNSLTGRMLLPIRSPQGEIALKGIPDLITPFTIEDHKTCSVSAIWYMEKDKHVEQLNLYRYLVEGVFGMTINKLVVNLFFNDWKRRRVGEKNYPEAPSQSYEVSLWDVSKTESYITSRMTTHFPIDDSKIPLCSEKERWLSEDKFAIMKKNNRRATKVCNTKEEAEEYAEMKGYAIGQTHFLEARKGYDKRCVDFCFVNRYCPYWQENYAGKVIEAAEE